MNNIALCLVIAIILWIVDVIQYSLTKRLIMLAIIERTILPIFSLIITAVDHRFGKPLEKRLKDVDKIFKP